MLKAALAQGRPIMVMAMMMAATTQPIAIHNPPINIQRMFSNIETGAMRSLRSWRYRRAIGAQRSCRSYDDTRQDQIELLSRRDIDLTPFPSLRTRRAADFA